MKKIIIICILSIILASCIGGAVTTAQIVYDRHEINQNWQSQSLAMEARNLLQEYKESFKTSHFTVSSFNHDILLVGQMPNQELKEFATKIIKQIPGYRRIINEVEIKKPISLAQKIRDSWITTKIKTKILFYNDIDPDNFKVITEDGIVYLLGDVDHKKARAVTHLAKNTLGVKKVKRVFLYIKYSKTI